MQPYFLPYLGYFDLANKVDLWIVYDVSQYVRRGWMNRNRVLHPVAGWQYVVAPVKKHRLGTPIHQIELATGEDWKTRLFRQLEHYRMDAPCYDAVIRLLKEVLAGDDHRLEPVNTSFFRRTCQRLGVATPIRVFSEMNLPIGPVQSTEELALAICREVGATEYINRPGGADQFHEANFADAGIKLTIQSFTNMTYPCGRFRFEPDMSIIDTMMWNSPEAIKRHLDTFRMPDSSEKEALCVN
ncbi:MAG: WbqC family protein [Pontiellaceae bacterium]|nr:WbqC family protein [Pontiellaceae bacterium]